MADEVLAAQDLPEEVAAHRALEGLEVQVGDVDARRVGAGVVHEDVDVAELGDRGAEQPLDLVFVAVVGLHDDRRAPLRLDLLARVVGSLLVLEVVDDHVGALARELDGARVPDP